MDEARDQVDRLGSCKVTMVLCSNYLTQFRILMLWVHILHSQCMPIYSMFNQFMLTVSMLILTKLKLLMVAIMTFMTFIISKLLTITFLIKLTTMVMSMVVSTLIFIQIMDKIYSLT